MNKNFTAKSEVTINVLSEKVWQALTDPALVKQWLFGTDMKVDKWEKGGQVRYVGVWEGKPYEDKGEIVEIIPGRKIVSTYWSPASGLPDAPENYQTVTSEIVPDGTATKLIVTQEGGRSEEQAKHSEGNWNTVLQNMKKILEGN